MTRRQSKMVTDRWKSEDRVKFDSGGGSVKWAVSIAEGRSHKLLFLLLLFLAGSTDESYDGMFQDMVG